MQSNEGTMDGYAYPDPADTYGQGEYQTGGYTGAKGVGKGGQGVGGMGESMNPMQQQYAGYEQAGAYAAQQTADYYTRQPQDPGNFIEKAYYELGPQIAKLTTENQRLLRNQEAHVNFKHRLTQLRKEIETQKAMQANYRELQVGHKDLQHKFGLCLDEIESKDVEM